MITIAHLSDVHLAPMPRVAMRELLSKRITGYANWMFKRRRSMRSDALQGLLAHLQTMDPDLTAVTGDLVNIAAKSEFAQSRAWLETLGPPEKVCVIPGNHDAYVRGALAEAKEQWGPYMRGETLNGSTFPYVRRLGDVAVIGCNSAAPMPPFVAAGEVDADQLERLGRILHLLGEAGYFRVVLIHHPPAGPKAFVRRRGLRGAKAFQKTIAEHGAELVLHGHLHEATVNAIRTEAGVEIPVIGVAAAAAAQGHNGSQPARYNLFKIEKLPASWSCTLSEYGYQRLGEDVVLRLKMRLY